MVRKSHIFIAVLVVFLGGCAAGAAAPEEERIGVVWTNGISDCPTSPEFGQLVAPEISLWKDAAMSAVVAKIPHDTMVDLLEEPGPDGMYRVRYNGQVGFISSTLIVPVDPSLGIRENPDDC
jgi:hypothetical protein